MDDLTFKVGEIVAFTLNKFCYGTTLTYIDVVGIDYNSTTQTLSYLPPGLTFNWATQKISGIPLYSGIYSIKMYKEVSTDEASSTFKITITGSGKTA